MLTEKKMWNDLYRHDEMFAAQGCQLLVSPQKISELHRDADKLLSNLRVKKGDKLLDVGCGSLGTIVVPALKKKAETYGMDISSVAISLLKKRIQKLKVGKAEFVEADAKNIPIEDNFFDFVISSSTLIHIKKIDKVISEMSRVLKSGGTMYASPFHNKKSFVNIPYTIIPVILGEKTKRRMFYTHHLSEIISIFRENDLVIEKAISFRGIFPFYIHVDFTKIFSENLVWKRIERLEKNAHTWIFYLKKN